ncbi:RT0821/Lpp0805 family surface protein [Azospirillum sp.]|uniref:RT0821/Lpp0805 family surface protein n=1 Tax=Azospirillum sp. TaxID=34012 RepID=UPI003D750046
MTIRKTLTCAALALSLAACQPPGGGFENMNTGETVGTVGGALGGALLGSRFGGGAGKVATIGIGTVLGALAGREAARYITGNDSRRAADAEERAVASNAPITWNNPETGNRGEIVPQRTYQSSTGQTCREYTHTIYVGGKAEQAQGTACRQADGTWKLVS